MIGNLNLDWVPIAKVEWRVSTSRIREIRPYLPYILTGGLVIFIFYLAPMFTDLYIDDFQAFILSQIAVVLVQFLLFFFFLTFACLPISSTLQDMKTDHFEIILSAPVKPSSLLIGEFLGKMPFYVTFAAIIGGLFTAALFPLGLDAIQILIIILIFVVTFLSALWIGTMAAVILRSFLMKTARGRDIGKGIAIIIIFPVIALFYAFIGGFMNLSDPETARLMQDVLQFFPSSWGSEVIVAFAQNPGDILAIEFNELVQLLGLIGFFFISLLFGGFIANRVYSLEPSSFSASKAKSDGIFYNTIKTIGGGGTFGLLISSSFKNYFRKVKNITMLAYGVGLVVVMNVFFMQPDDSVSAMMGSFIMGPLIALFTVSDVTLQGKENLLLYKQTPSGTARYLKAKLFHYLLIVVPLTVLLEAVICLRVPAIVIEGLLMNLGLSFLISSSTTIIVLGIFLLNPAYHDKAGEYMLNMQICVFGVIVPFFVCLIFLDQPLYDLFGIIDAFYYTLVVYSIFLWIMAGITLYLGARKLSNLE
ncbi:MAG: ABC transporter permease [Candidatus Hodarchaeota archaeon]